MVIPVFYCPKHWLLATWWVHPSVVLSTLCWDLPQHIRHYATKRLGTLIRESVNVNSWTLRLLLTQLYDPASDVCQLAVEILKEACDSKEILELVVEMHPTMDHLGEMGHGLLLKFVFFPRFLCLCWYIGNRFMSTPVGFRFLYDAGYIYREMEDWFNVGLIFVIRSCCFLNGK